MSPGRAARVTLLTAILAISSVAAMNAPPIGAGARFQSDELGPGWPRGFFNQMRTVPPCYLLMTFVPRSSPDDPLRVKQTIPIARVQRLQVTSVPGSSMQEWDGLALPAVPESEWREVELGPLRPAEGQCRFDKPIGS